MATTLWNETYRLGIDEVDTQHEQLFVILDRLAAAVADHHEHDVIDGVVGDLVEYAGTHFRFEEKMMLVHNYADRVEHKKLHAKFVREVGDVAERFRSGETAAAAELVTFLNDWLREHINVEDRRYCESVNGSH